MPSDLTCSYLGLSLNSPVVVGACPLSLEPESLRQIVSCGAGAIVLPSIFQEQIAYQEELHQAALASADRALALRRDQYNSGLDGYLANIATIKRTASVPVIASLNGYGDGQWLEFAKRMEASGADALELNIQPLIESRQQTAAEVESTLCEVVRNVCQSVSIPVAVKLTQRFTNLINVAHRLREAGAAGLVLYAHEPRWDVAIDRLHWTIHWELTPVDSVGSTVAGIVHSRASGLELSIAASGGIRTAEDAIKVMIAGADVAMVTSELYRSGPDAIRKLLRGLERYLETNGFASLSQFQKSRPAPELRSHLMARRDYLEQLTQSLHYSDPTPVAPQQTGDRYGHAD